MLFFTLVFQSYFAIAFLVFSVFFKSFLQDESTPYTHLESWVVIGLSSMFWLIVIPLAYLEHQDHKSYKT